MLLIACANVANLLLARASTRRSEIAARATLGASRGRLVRQLLVESLVLAFGGAAIGLAIAVAGVELLKVLGPDAVPRIEEVSLDERVLVFTLGITIVVALLFGLSPALRLAGTSPVEKLRNDARSGQHPREGWSRAALLAIEVALSLVLLVGAGLLTRSLVRLYDVDLGFDGRDVVRFELAVPGTRYESLASLVSFYHALEERLSALPGVEAAGSAIAPPLTARAASGEVHLDGEPDPERSDESRAEMRPVTPGYFDAMRLGLRRGRVIEPTDRNGAIPVAVVNETFVRQNLGAGDPIGKRFRITYGNTPTWTIVGVVGDVRGTLRSEPEAAVYVPHAQYGANLNLPPSTPAERSLFVHVRGETGARNLFATVRAQVHALDPNLSLQSPQAVSEAISEDAAPTRFVLLLLGLFAGLAVLLATVGLYGVVSYLVSRRTREIGIRLALGAPRVTITHLVLRHALWPALLGITRGLLASVAVTRVMRSLLFEVEPTDPLVLAGVSVLLLVIAAVASLVPARRAARVNPIEVLRIE